MGLDPHPVEELIGFHVAFGKTVPDISLNAVANLGYGTASILLVQLCALLFDNLIRRAAVAAGAETEARARLLAADRIADAVQAEYRRRYADLADTIRPLLLVLAAGGTVDATTARSAQIEYQRLRALFDQSAAFDHVLLRELRPAVDAFFDNVMVMCDDMDMRLNRLNLLKSLVDRLGRVADFAALQM